MPDPADDGAWIEFQQNVRQHWSTRHIDYVRIASEFSKLVITSLVAINTGGLLSIPAITSFLKWDMPSHEKLNVFAIPFAMYVAGIANAVLCAFYTYVNFSKHAERASIEIVNAENTYGYWRAYLLQNEGMLAAMKVKMDDINSVVIRQNVALRHTNRLALLTGWISAFLFAVASCIFLGQVLRAT